MTLLRALVSRFSALLGDVYYEGTVPSGAPYPYAGVSAKIPAAFGGTGEITLCCYERGGDSHTRIAEKMARVMRFSGSLVHYGGGLALLQSPQCAIGHEKGGVTVLRTGADRSSASTHGSQPPRRSAAAGPENGFSTAGNAHIRAPRSGRRGSIRRPFHAGEATRRR